MSWHAPWLLNNTLNSNNSLYNGGLTFWHCKKTNENHRIAVCTTNVVVNITYGEVERVIVCLTGCYGYSSLVATKDDGNQCCSRFCWIFTNDPILRNQY